MPERTTDDLLRLRERYEFGEDLALHGVGHCRLQ